MIFLEMEEIPAVHFRSLSLARLLFSKVSWNIRSTKSVRVLND